MSRSNEGEGGKLIAGNFDSSAAPAEKPLTEAQRMQKQKVKQKQTMTELADYKKRLRSSNELKQMQVDELKLGIDYYKYKVEFKKLKPKMDELDAIEEAEAKKEQERQKKEYDAYMATQIKLEEERKAKEEEEKKPLIIKTGGGVPRSKE